MVRKFSIYAPRRRRSPRFILAYIGTFFFILWATWYISTRHAETARPYVEEFLHPGSAAARRAAEQAAAAAAERKPVGGPAAAARAVVNEGREGVVGEGAKPRTIIIGISGCSSSGKTTLARLLRDWFPETFILHEDDFYKPESE
ncbi:hypothetical protein VTJ49DRAFT_1178 [Mycothermus thermophilus]|uniref:Uncharacterized protein n=1 Tax=Humicola insolens TaxID=85995 RepID=A0ABR3VDP5_HUMIN